MPAPIIRNAAPTATNSFALEAAASPEAFVPAETPKSFAAKPLTPFAAIEVSERAKLAIPGTTLWINPKPLNAPTRPSTHGVNLEIVPALSKKKSPIDFANETIYGHAVLTAPTNDLITPSKASQ